MAVTKFEHSSRFLPNRIDSLAREQPLKPFICLPKDDDISSFEDITYKQFANAINGASHFLDEKLGKCKQNAFDTIAYIGKNDLRYLILVVAAVKTGRKLLSASTWTSVEGKKNLFNLTNTKALLRSIAPQTKEVLEELDRENLNLHVIDVPPLGTWLDGEVQFPHYPYLRTWEEGINDPFVIFHTSGTMGLPKPLVYTNATMQCYDAMAQLRHSGQHLSTHDMTGRRIYVSFAMPHLGGFGHLLLYPVFFDYVGINVTQFLPSAAILDKVLSTTSVSAAVLYPALIEEIARRDATTFSPLSNLDIIWWGGAPLSQSLGDSLCKLVDLRTKYGTTEITWPAFEVVGSENWNYVRISACVGVSFVEFSKGLYELRMVKQAGYEILQVAFQVHPSKEEYSTGDLWSRHPSERNCWRYRGRVDDMVKLSTGQSVNVAAFETKIAACPLVSGVLVLGTGRPRLCLILELAGEAPTTKEEKCLVVDQIWPLIEEANAACNENGRLVRERVLLLGPKRPLKRLLKGTVDRRAAAIALADDLSLLYSREIAVE